MYYINLVYQFFIKVKLVYYFLWITIYLVISVYNWNSSNSKLTSLLWALCVQQKQFCCASSKLTSLTKLPFSLTGITLSTILLGKTKYSKDVVLCNSHGACSGCFCSFCFFMHKLFQVDLGWIFLWAKNCILPIYFFLHIIHTADWIFMKVISWRIGTKIW